MQMFSSENEEKAKEFVENLRQKLVAARGQKFTFLLIGRTGVGKSSTVNSLMGQEVAHVGDYEPTTMEIKRYNNEINGVNFTVIDTPGLCDDLEEAQKDYKYLEMMRSNVSQIDSMWFVTRLDDTRVTSDEKKGIKLICEAFKPKIWEQAVIVFTFANNLDKTKYPIALEKRTSLIRQEIAKYTGIGIANNIPAVAVDNTSETTPDEKKWLSELYTQVYIRMSVHGAAPFFTATVERIKPPEKEKEFIYVNQGISTPTYSNYIDDRKYPPTRTYSQIELDDRQTELVRNKSAEVFKLVAAGATLGASIGAVAGPMASVIGGAVGAAIGFVAGWFNK